MHAQRGDASMKFTLAIFAVLAIAGPLSAYKLPSTGSGQLAKDLQDVVDMIQFDKVFDITRAYLAQDKEVQLMAALVDSQDSKKLIQYVENEPVFKKLVAFMQENGLDIYYLINKYNEFIQIPQFKPSVALQREITGGVVGYVEDIAAITPMDKMMHVIEDRLKTSKPLSELVKLASTPEVVSFVESLRSNEFFLNIEKQADQNGLGSLNVDRYYTYFAMVIPAARSTF
ncbi:protein G12-like isoform X1 [Megachile rotundata]|uniref:protein G12-like isoform X1 n=2 Tax=Megachile rotundata TaxID=143995 RepID=UPI003FD2D9F8